MIKVLNILTSLQRGGSEAVAVNYLNHIDSSKFRVDFLVLSSQRGQYYDDILRRQGCNVYYITSTKENLRKGKKEFEDFLANYFYDIIHIHSMSSLKIQYVQLIKKNSPKTKIFYHSHTSGGSAVSKVFHKVFRPKLKKYCDILLACGITAGKYMYGKKAQFHVLRNAIQADKFLFDSHKRSELRKKHHCEKAFVIGHVGRIREEKNHVFLIKAFYELQKIRENVRLCLVWADTANVDIFGLIKELNLEDKVISVHNAENAFEYYNMFDVLAMPSLYEGLSLCMVEAQFNGLDILSSDKVPSEVNYTGDITFLPINKQDKLIWTEALRTREIKDIRNKTLEKMNDAGYNIKTAVLDLEKFYIEAINSISK